MSPRPACTPHRPAHTGTGRGRRPVLGHHARTFDDLGRPVADVEVGLGDEREPEAARSRWRRGKRVDGVHSPPTAGRAVVQEAVRLGAAASSTSWGEMPTVGADGRELVVRAMFTSRNVFSNTFVRLGGLARRHRDHVGRWPKERRGPAGALGGDAATSRAVLDGPPLGVPGIDPLRGHRHEEVAPGDEAVRAARCLAPAWWCPEVTVDWMTTMRPRPHACAASSRAASRSGGRHGGAVGTGSGRR